MDSTCDTIKFEGFIKRIIQTWNPNDQLYFLKIFPIFRVKLRLISIWINTYNDYISQKNKVSSLSISNNDFSMCKRESIITFLLLGLTHEYLESEMTDVAQILILMKNAGEDEEYINHVKSKFMNLGITHEISKNMSKSTESLNESILNSEINSIDNEIIKDLSSFSAEAIAFELTRMHSELIKKINIHELINLAISDKCDQKSYQNLSKLIDNFDRLSYFVRTEIFIKRENSDRIQFAKKIVRVAMECKKLNNIHGLFSIIVGLGNGSINQLTELWRPKWKYTKLYKELEMFVSPVKNYSKCRQYVESLGKNSVIPYVGLILSDIKHLSECEIYEKETIQLVWDIYNKYVQIIRSYESLNKSYVIPVNKQLFVFFDGIQYSENNLTSRDSSTKISPNKRFMSTIFKSSTRLRKSSFSVPIGSTNELTTENQSIVMSDEKQSPHLTNEEKQLFNLDNEKQPIELINENQLIEPNEIINGKQLNENLNELLNEENKSFIANKNNNKINRKNTFQRQYTNTENDEEQRKQYHRHTSNSKSNKSGRHSIDLKLLLDNNKVIRVESPRSMAVPRKCRSLSTCDYKSFSIKPSEIEKWDTLRVSQWLCHIGMREYVDIFKVNEINGFSLTELTELHLKEMNINKLGHRITIIKHIYRLKRIAL